MATEVIEAPHAIYVLHLHVIGQRRLLSLQLPKQRKENDVVTSLQTLGRDDVIDKRIT